VTFSVASFRRAVAEYDCSWRATDEALYALCRRHPGHADQAGVNAKLWIIGRTYATGIERKIPANGKQGGSMSQLADHLLNHARQVDDIFRRLRQLAEPLDPHKLRAIIDLHGRFIALIQPVVHQNQSPRSFASKYMHFHNPAVPIIDTYAEAACRKMIRWHKSFCLFDLPIGADEYYAWYVLRFWQLYRQARAAGLELTVKYLDYYLLSAGEAMA
jgi:hypothetical protein